MQINYKYVVIKGEDIDNSLTDLQKSSLGHLLKIIEDNRTFRGKKQNKYIVVNVDEPYAKIVELLVETFDSVR